MCICVPVHVCPICSACAPPLLCVAARAAPPLQLCSRCHAAAAVPPWVRFFFAAVLRARPCAVGGPGRAGGAGYPGRYPARPMPPRCRCASVLACCTRGYRWARSSASLLAPHPSTPPLVRFILPPPPRCVGRRVRVGSAFARLWPRWTGAQPAPRRPPRPPAYARDAVWRALTGRGGAAGRAVGGACIVSFAWACGSLSGARGVASCGSGLRVHPGICAPAGTCVECVHVCVSRGRLRARGVGRTPAACQPLSY